MEKEIEERAKEYIIKVNDTEFAVPKMYLADFIMLCDESGVGILGFDGLKIEDGEFIPMIEWIADFSELTQKEYDWETFQKASIASSMKFLEKVGEDNLYFIPSLSYRK